MVVLLLISLMMLILGILLAPVYAGLLPYYEGGLFSLLIIVAALQILALGKSPFGDVQRTLPTVILGVIIAIFGIVVCFIPDIFGIIPRLLLILFFGLGGVIQLVKLFWERDEERNQETVDPLIGKLKVARGLVYLFSVILGIILIFQSLIAGLVMCIAVLGYSITVGYLCWILWQVYRKYPPSEPAGTVSLSVGNVMLLLLGTFMVVLGVILIPVNLGLLPFSPSSQLGMMLVIFAMQMMFLGETPLGACSRSHLIVGLGCLLAIFGVICSLIPGVLLIVATLLVAIVNILGGILGLGRTVIMVKSTPKTDQPVPPIFLKLLGLQIAMNVLSIMFGTSMIAAGLIPGIVIGPILAINGCFLLTLLFTLRKLEQPQATAA